ncbi:SPOC like C-terminal domain-containing protein [Spinellus fusiger]|nr:SPOC like C-terminal domain-containing protein [Spinellus fusiger]
MDITTPTPPSDFQRKNNESTLFVVDCSLPMLEQTNNTPILEAFRFLERMLVYKAHNHINDNISVLLYNTKAKQNDTDDEGIFILQPFEAVNPAIIKKVDALAKGDINFEEMYGSIDSTSLTKVFWVCSNLFASKTQSLDMRRLFLITNQDDPHMKDSLLKEAACSQIKELGKIGVETVLCGLDTPYHAFNPNIFYKPFDTFFSKTGDVVEGSYESPRTTFDRVLKQDAQQRTSNRFLFTLPFTLTPGLTVGVTGLKLVMAECRPSLEHATYTQSEDTTHTQLLQPVETSIAYKCASTGRFLTSEDIMKSYEYGGEKVLFTKQELIQLRTFRQPGMVVLGFKPQTSLQWHCTVGSSFIIAPDESAYIGSTRLLHSLHTTLLKMNRIAICSMVIAGRLTPRIVALIPQPELSVHSMVSPFVFSATVLPYADDIRALPVQSTPKVTLDQIQAAKAIIQSHTPRQDPFQHTNPEIQRYRAMLEAYVLDREYEQIIDSTLPDVLETSVRDLITEFKTETELIKRV